MNKLKPIISSLILSLCSLSASANDNCLLLDGVWKGFYTIKDKALCDQYHGCQHLVKAKISYLSQNKFSVKLNYALGTLQETVPFQCENGKISLPIPGNFDIKFSCDEESDTCFINSDSDRFYAELINN